MEIQIFKNDRFGEVRTMVINDEPWFVGKDVAEVLGYRLARKALYDHVEDDDKKGVPIQNPLGGKQEMTIINESGLYSLILSSKLPQAKEFKRWVTLEVLGYAKPENTLARHVDAENKRGTRFTTSGQGRG
jgi:prophage antirepressor-like protein